MIPSAPTRPDIGSLGPEVAEIAAPRQITAEWALWGKEASETSYHVLRCSTGALREKDFSEVVTRYSPGELDSLPQYTVSWIPDANRVPEYVVLSVHERAPADPRQGGGRSRRDAAGREIVFVRVFCLRYAELARHTLAYSDQGLGYQDLLTAVAGLQLPAGRTEPVSLTLPAEPSPIIRRRPIRRQAEQVATMLLTGRQVCVLGAEDVPAADRLRFIDTVMGLLPYGMRAGMSAATMASSTSQELKLRLFFASVPRAGGRLGSGRPAKGEDFLVEWGHLDQVAIPDRAAELYQEWLKDVKSQAPAMLAEHVHPVRFTPADIRRMVSTLPKDKPVTATLNDLGKTLAAAELNVEAVRGVVKRLCRYLAGADRPADPPEVQRQYRRQVCQLRLLANDERLSPQLKEQLYDQLLRVAFGPALTYDGYCDIENSVGFPPHDDLRAALARFRAADWLAYVLAREGQPNFRSGRGYTDGTPQPDGNPLEHLIVRVAERTLQQRHGQAVLEWTLRDQATRGLPPEELAVRQYLAAACAYLYPDDQHAQVTQLKRILKFAFGDQLLSKPQIDAILAPPAPPPTQALGFAVMEMTGRINLGYAQEQMRKASLRARGVPESEWYPQRGSRWLRWRRRPAVPPGSGPRNHIVSTESAWAHPRVLGTLVITCLVVFAVVYLVVVWLLRAG